VSHRSLACCASAGRASRGVVVVADSCTIGSSSALRSPTHLLISLHGAARDGIDLWDTPRPFCLRLGVVGDAPGRSAGRREQAGRLPAVTARDQADVMEVAPGLAREQEFGALPRAPHALGAA